MKRLLPSLVIAAQAPAAVTDSIVGLRRTDPTQKVCGCVGISLLGRTTVWERVDL